MDKQLNVMKAEQEKKVQEAEGKLKLEQEKLDK